MKRLCLAIGLLPFFIEASAKDLTSNNIIAINFSTNEPTKLLKISKKNSGNILKSTVASESAKAAVASLNNDYQPITSMEAYIQTQVVPSREKNQANDPTKNANTITCFNNKSGIGLLQSKDLEGRDILAFPLDRLKNNVRYGFIENYKQGFARIKKDGVWGFINLCGDEIVPCQYDKAEAFNEGKALVKRQEWHFTDSFGNESEALSDVIDAKALMKGLSLVKLKNTQMALIDNNYDKTGKPVSALYDDIIVLNNNTLGVKINNKWGVYKLGEGAIADVNYDSIERSEKENLFKVSLNKKIGLIDQKGEVLWKPEFNIITDVDNYGYIKGIGDNKQQLLNINDLRVSKAYKKISDFDNRGLGIIQGENNLFGLIDKDLKSVIEPQYATIGAVGEFELLPVSKEIEGKGLRFGFINLKGQEIIPIDYEAVGKINKKGLLVVKEVVSCNLDAKGAKLGTCKADKVIDVNGSTVILPITKYPDAGKINYVVTDSMVHNCIVVKAYKNDEKNKGMKFMLVRGSDFKVITPEPFDFVQAVSKYHFFFIRQNGLWGTLDTTGKYLSKCQFKTVLMASEDYYLVQHENGKYGYLDTKGKVQITPDYQTLEYFKNGLAIATKGNNQVGLINKFNARIIPCTFKEIRYLDATKEYQVTDKDNNRFLLNEQGECYQNCIEFENIRQKANNN